MAKIHIENGVLLTERFGDPVKIRVPKGGTVDIRPSRKHADVLLRERSGAIARSFRLPKEDG